MKGKGSVSAKTFGMENMYQYDNKINKNNKE